MRFWKSKIEIGSILILIATRHLMQVVLGGGKDKIVPALLKHVRTGSTHSRYPFR